MEVHHKPKPFHNWREFVSEVAIVVIGVLIALGSEQAIEAMHWRHKVEVAREGLRSELQFDLANAWAVVQARKCTADYLDRLEAAIVIGDRGAVRALSATPPFAEHRPWLTNSWEATLPTQVADHLSRKELASYAVLYTGVGVTRQHHFQMRDFYEEAVTARFDLPREAAASQLAALGKLRGARRLVDEIAAGLLYTAREDLHLEPAPKRVIELKAQLADGRCPIG